mgnify:CR=1 FL=1
MITETETAFLAVIRAFLTEEKASPAEIQGLTEKQWNHLFVLAAQHSLLSAVYDVEKHRNLRDFRTSFADR